MLSIIHLIQNLPQMIIYHEQRDLVLMVVLDRIAEAKVEVAALRIHLARRAGQARRIAHVCRTAQARKFHPEITADLDPTMGLEIIRRERLIQVATAPQHSKDLGRHRNLDLTPTGMFMGTLKQAAELAEDFFPRTFNRKKTN